MKRFFAVMAAFCFLLSIMMAYPATNAEANGKKAAEVSKRAKGKKAKRYVTITIRGVKYSCANEKTYFHCPEYKGYKKSHVANKRHGKHKKSGKSTKSKQPAKK